MIQDHINQFCPLLKCEIDNQLKAKPELGDMIIADMFDEIFAVMGFKDYKVYDYAEDVLSKAEQFLREKQK